MLGTRSTIKKKEQAGLWICKARNFQTIQDYLHQENEYRISLNPADDPSTKVCRNSEWKPTEMWNFVFHGSTINLMTKIKMRFTNKAQCNLWTFILRASYNPRVLDYSTSDHRYILVHTKAFMIESNKAFMPKTWGSGVFLIKSHLRF